MSAVTLKDIARKTGKSVTTVSRALADYDDVSPKTKELIKKVAAEMGYTPNLLARRLQKQRTDTIGLILPTFGPRFSDPFFSELLAGVGNKAAEFGYDLLVSTQTPGEKELATYRFKVQSRQVDGFVVVRTRRQDERIRYLQDVDFPFVAFGRTDGDLDYPYVDEDSEYGMRLVVKHVIELGHRRIGCIAPPPHLMFAHYRLQGIYGALAEVGLTLEHELLQIGDLTQRAGYNKAERLLKLPHPPTAIIACNDLMALGAMSAAQNHGLVVGQDITITGFDDIPMAEHSHPPLTTVRQPIYKIGGLVCEILLRRLQGDVMEQEQVLLKPTLIVRQSSSQARI